MGILGLYIEQYSRFEKIINDFQTHNLDNSTIEYVVCAFKNYFFENYDEFRFFNDELDNHISGIQLNLNFLFEIAFKSGKKNHCDEIKDGFKSKKLTSMMRGKFKYYEDAQIHILKLKAFQERDREIANEAAKKAERVNKKLYLGK